MKRIGMLGAAVLAAGFLWADDPAPQTPGIALHRVQQRYPWNGKVDIDYTVSNVVNAAQFFVRFKVTENGNTHILHEFLDTSTLCDASNGTYRVTWDSAAETYPLPYQFIDKNANVQAELVYCDDDKSSSPYGNAYLIIDLSGGSTATEYPVTTEYIGDDVTATTRFNDGNYKTNCLVLRRVRAGNFTMGSSQAEYKFWEGEIEGGMYNETNHQVTLTKDFLFGMFPVTQAQYEKVMGTNPSSFKQAYGAELTAERPVETVSYEMIRGSGVGISTTSYGNYDANSFLGCLERRTGLTFDLPTEAQWEYACRAGTTSATPWGSAASSFITSGGRFWYTEKTGTARNADGVTHAVGLKRANNWSFFDICGNVWEMCLDRVDEATKGDLGPDAVTDPLSAESGGNIVLRGGSWKENYKYQRSACRLGTNGVTSAGNNIGFRLSRTIP